MNELNLVLTEAHLDLLLAEELLFDRELLCKLLGLAFSDSGQLWSPVDIADVDVALNRWENGREPADSGETDLVVVATSTTGEIRQLLIENKRGAALQPNQAERYSARAANSTDRMPTRAVIVAPAAYLESHRAVLERFHARFSIEDVATLLASANTVDPRRLWRVQQFRMLAQSKPSPESHPQRVALTRWFTEQFAAAGSLSAEIRVLESAYRTAAHGWLYLIACGGSEVIVKFDQKAIHLNVRYADRNDAALRDIREVERRLDGSRPSGWQLGHDKSRANVVLSTPIGSVPIDDCMDVERGEPLATCRQSLEGAVESTLHLVNWLETDGLALLRGA